MTARAASWSRYQSSLARSAPLARGQAMCLTEGLMLLLQVACCGGAVWRGDNWKALYWLGAFVVTLAVVKGIK